jgi:uncharacterized Zn finger protein (UPF0148 family)
MNVRNTNIVQAMESEKLFGKTFKRRMLRGDSWARWKVFLSALFGLPLDDAGRKTFTRFTARTDAPTTPFREAFVIAGRRSGKSFIAALVAVYCACFVDHSEELAAGEIGTVLIVGADRSQCRVILGYVRALLAIPALKGMVTSELKESIELSNRIRIEVGTCDFKSLRGSTIVCAVCDELAFWKSDDSSSPDVEVLRAIRPAMSTIKNPLLLCISSPYGKKGALFAAYRDYFGKASEILVWKASSKEMNPTLPVAVIAKAYLQDPQAARSEFGGEFRDDVSSFLPPEVVERAMVRNRFELPPMLGVRFVPFCDPSGGSSDSFTLAIGFWDSLRSMAVLACVREIPAPFSPEAAVAELAGVLKKYGCNEVLGDKYAGSWPSEAFSKQGISYRASELVRSEIYLEFLPGLMSNQIELLDNERLKSQLCGLERRTSRSGKDAVDHGASGHDDVANAAAGCLVEILRVNGIGGAFSLLDYEKSGRAQKDLDRALLKASPSTLFTLKIPPCPSCNSVASPIPGGFRCAQCAVQFDADGKILFRPSTAQAETGCPSCGSSLYRVIAGGGHRCAQCGYQSTSQLPKNGTRRTSEFVGAQRGSRNSRGFLNGLFGRRR